MEKSKTVITIALVAIVVVASGAGAYHFFNEKKSVDDLSDWDGTHIAGFNQFKYLGAGASVKTPATASNILNASAESLSSESSDTETYKLVGITGSGQCEIVKFLDKSGNNIEQRANLVYFASEKAYSLACFSTFNHSFYYPSDDRSTYTNYYIYTDGFRDYCFVEGMGIGTQAFIIDNNNGNMYSIKSVLCRLGEKCEQGIGIYLSKGSDQIYAYFTGFEKGDPKSLLQLSFTDSELQITTLMDGEQFVNFYGSDFFIDRGLSVDRYSNVFSKTISVMNGYLPYVNFDASTKFMKADHTFSTLKSADPYYSQDLLYEYNLAFNDILYSRAYSMDQYNHKVLQYTAYLDVNGVFTQTIADPISNISLGYTNTVGATVDYMYYNGGYNMKIQIAKYADESPWTYTVTTIDVCSISGNNSSIVETFAKSSAFNGSNIYCLNGNVLYDIDVDALEVTQIDSPNEIKSVSFDDEVHQVKITAVLLSTLQTVEGYIDESKTGNEKLIFEPYTLRYGAREVICIAPVNA